MNHGDHSNHAGHSMATYFYFGYNDVQMVLENWVIDSITSLLIACLILIIIVIFAEYLRLWRENFQLAMIQKIQSRPDSSLSSSNRDETDKMISSSTSKVSKSNQVSNSWRGGLSRVFRFSLVFGKLTYFDESINFGGFYMLTSVRNCSVYRNSPISRNIVF